MHNHIAIPQEFEDVTTMMASAGWRDKLMYSAAFTTAFSGSFVAV